MKCTSNCDCVNKCNNLCRLKTVSVSNFKLWSGEVGWNNKVVLRAYRNGGSVSMLMTSGGVGSRLLWLSGRKSMHMYWRVRGFVCSCWDCCFVCESMRLPGVAVTWYLGGCVLSCKRVWVGVVIVMFEVCPNQVHLLSLVHLFCGSGHFSVQIWLHFSGFFQWSLLSGFQ